ncbi:hypothetical protein GQ44DRAFT_770308 [Phaeosphaeriaceae sp. PMI808]|nr:hypothetical protein GQ44DRAFT_770308 [Phaeosphaeriaceae sp. PMI808]
MPNMTSSVIPPPPGLTANFDNPPSLAPRIIAVSISLVVVASIFVGLRGYTILFILHTRGIADYLLAIGWLLAVVYSILIYVCTQFGLGRHFWDVPFSTFNVKYFKVGAVAGTFYGMSIMFTKLSILHFYLRFLLARPHLRKIVYAVMVIVVVYSFVTSFEWLYACRPLEKYWDLTITEGSCVNHHQFTVANGIMNVVTDAIILLFPLAILRDLQNLAPREKVAVTGIMMTGGLVVGISIIRAKTNIDMLHITDMTWDGARIVIWW